jgi:hypothetical protein
MRRLTTLAMMLAVVGGLAGCGGSAWSKANAAAKQPECEHADNAQALARPACVAAFRAECKATSPPNYTAAHESACKLVGWYEEGRDGEESEQGKKEIEVEKLTGAPYIDTCRVNGECPEREVRNREEERREIRQHNEP